VIDDYMAAGLEKAASNGAAFLLGGETLQGVL